jgi:hypothetical protein
LWREVLVIQFFDAGHSPNGARLRHFSRDSQGQLEFTGAERIIESSVFNLTLDILQTITFISYESE